MGGNQSVLELIGNSKFFKTQVIFLAETPQIAVVVQTKPKGGDSRICIVKAKDFFG